MISTTVAGEIVEALRRVPLLAGLDEAELTELAGSFRERTFPVGATLTREGERGARVIAFFIIRTGTAQVSKNGVQVATLGPGDHVGEIGLFHDVPRTATVTASTELDCLALGSWEFRPFVESHPTVAWRLLESMSERLAELELAVR
jgi:CRP-like cAMP-binding protein